MRNLVLALALLAACDDSPQLSDAQFPVIVNSACAGPETFGAVADDGLDDVPAIQAAIDACDGGTVQFPPGGGTYTLAPPPATGDWRTSSLHIIHGLTLDLNGAMLQMAGDNVSGDWYGIHVGRNVYNGGEPATAYVRIQNGTLAVGDVVNTTEQTHLVQVGHSLGAAPYGVYTVELSGLGFYQPETGASSGGDCIRLLGEVATPVSGVLIHDNIFLDCDRSGIAFQRGTTLVTVENNLFLGAGNSHIDFEPTSLGAVDSTVIKGNLFGPVDSAWAVSLSGSDNTLSSDILLTANIITDGGIDSYNLSRATISDNIIVNTAQQVASVQFIKAAKDIKFTGNRIYRLTGSNNAAVVSVSHHNSGMPSRLTFDGNSIYNETGSSTFNVQSATDLVFSNNRLESTVGGQAFITLTSTVQNIDGVLITGNKTTGPGLALARMAASGSLKIGAVSIVGNMTQGTLTNSIVCQGAGLLVKPLVHAANYYDGAPPIGCTSAHGSVVGQYP